MSNISTKRKHEHIIENQYEIENQLLHWLIKLNGRFSQKASLTIVCVLFRGSFCGGEGVKITPSLDDDDELFLWCGWPTKGI